MYSVAKIVLSISCCFTCVMLQAQEERGLVRSGNQRYIEGAQLEADSINLAYKKWDEAASNYKEALKIDSTLPEGHFNLGDVAYKKGDFETAVAEFEKAILYSNDTSIKAKAHHNIGNCYLRQFEYEKSIAAYKDALRLFPGDRDTKYNLAYAQHRLKVKKESEGGDDKKNEDKEASAYAKKIKAEAEDLVKQKRYTDAYDLLMEGMQKDSTMTVFKDFIKRVQDVAETAPPETEAVPQDPATLKK